jgi:uncharacterized protein
VIYFDTSALVKLIFEESGSAALAQWATDQGEVANVTSELSVVELLRTCARIDVTTVGDAERLLAGLDLVPMARGIVQHAAVLNPKELRSLDAIHLASACSLGPDLRAMVVYDGRLGAAAAMAGLHVVAPT